MNLAANGKPMRALRALSGSDTCNPLTEYGIYRACEEASGRPPGNWLPINYHAALATLCARGLAMRTGIRGGYQWFITAEGREALNVPAGRRGAS